LSIEEHIAPLLRDKNGYFRPVRAYRSLLKSFPIRRHRVRKQNALRGVFGPFRKPCPPVQEWIVQRQIAQTSPIIPMFGKFGVIFSHR